jgi:hypothetical protein
MTAGSNRCMELIPGAALPGASRVRRAVVRADVRRPVARLVAEEASRPLVALRGSLPI